MTTPRPADPPGAHDRGTQRLPRVPAQVAGLHAGRGIGAGPAGGRPGRRRPGGDRRRELVKVARSKGEDAKVAIRNIRRRSKEELDRISKDGEAGEDDVRRAEKELESLTHTYVGHVDEALKHKEAELLEV